MSTDSAIDTSTVAEPQTREIDLIGLDGTKAGTVELPGAIFDVQVNVPLIHQVVVAQRSDELTWQSLRNAPTVHMLVPDQLNTYDVLVSDDIVFTHEALLEFLAGPSKGRAVTASATESEAATEGSEK